MCFYSKNLLYYKPVVTQRAFWIEFGVRNFPNKLIIFSITTCKLETMRSLFSEWKEENRETKRSCGCLKSFITFSTEIATPIKSRGKQNYNCTLSSCRATTEGGR